MPTVQNVATRADGSAAGLTRVVIRLVGTDGEPVIGYTASGSVVASKRITAGADGAWSASLPASSLITPAGTAYEVIETSGGEPSRSSIITMPTLGGPYQLRDLLTAAPGSLLPAISAAGVSFTPNGSIAASNVQAAIQEVRDEAAIVEIDYKEHTIAGGVNGPLNVATDIPGCALTVPASTRPFAVAIRTLGSNNTNGGYCFLNLQEGAAVLGSALEKSIVFTDIYTLREVFRFPAPASPRTFKLTVQGIVAGTANANGNSSAGPTYIHAWWL